MTTAIESAFLMLLRRNVEALLATMRDIPEGDLNHWKPVAAREGDQAMTTFAAIAIHTVSAGEFMTLHSAGGAPSDRDREREREFVATGTLTEIEARYARWLEATERLLETLSEADLAEAAHAERHATLGWTRADVLLHALDHTALHVGHAELQRQLWEYERS